MRMLTTSTPAGSGARRKVTASVVVVLLSAVVLAGCVTPVPLGSTKFTVYDAEAGRKIFVGQFGPSAPTRVVLQLRVAGALAGTTFCVSLAPIPSEPPANLLEPTSGAVQAACQLVPIAAGDVDVVFDGFGSGWDEEAYGPIEGRWYVAHVTAELPQPMQIPLLGVRGILLDGVPSTTACLTIGGITPCRS